MTIVINEIEINVLVTSGDPSGHSATQGNPSSKEAIIKECVEKVMEIINQKNER